MNLMDDTTTMLSPNVLAALQKMRTFPGATDVEIAQLKRLIGEGAPDEYYDLLLYTNGADGFVGDGKYFILYSVALCVELGRRHEDEFAPGLFIIGSNGGGTAFGIDLRGCNTISKRYVAIEEVSLDCDEVDFQVSSLSLLFEYLAEPYHG